METPDWLLDAERFDRFEEQVKERLLDLRRTRICFLQHAATVMDALLGEARGLRAEELALELERGLAAARQELSDLQRGEVPAPDVPAGSAPPAAGRRTADADPSAPGSPAVVEPVVAPTDDRSPAETSAQGSALSIGADPEAEQPGPDSPSPVPAAPVPAAPVPAAPVPASSVSGTAGAARPAAPAGQAPPVSGVPSPPRRSWTPRERSLVDSEVERIAGQVRGELPAGPEGLLRLKAAACRLRRAYEELEVSGHYTGDVRAARGLIQGRIREEYGEPYVLPLDTHRTPDQAGLWEELAEAYEGLIPAVAAFDWFRDHATELKKAEAEELLNAIGASQQRLFRLLDEAFAGGDDQQKQLYAEVRDSGVALSIYVESLHPTVSDGELAQRAARLEKRFRDLRTGVEKRLAQVHTLAGLQALLAEPRFGIQDKDGERLQAAARACLEAGVPKTKPELRNSLLEWEVLLEGDARLHPLLEEIRREKERRLKKGDPLGEDDEAAGKKLTTEVERLRQELLAHTRGKRCLFVGGHVRAEHRERIQAALELATLEWPETDRFDASPHAFAADVKRNDIVVLLIRFMRTGMKGVTELCREEGKPVVRLPRGLGVGRVVTNFHEQLLPRR